ncbi:MAG: hypothetical protein L6U99_12730 [Clostridium sp.]|nr:MAG: hypothetical protein L6U99_12730 [Clostridium sp.]
MGIIVEGNDLKKLLKIDGYVLWIKGTIKNGDRKNMKIKIKMKKQDFFTIQVLNLRLII